MNTAVRPNSTQEYYQFWSTSFVWHWVFCPRLWAGEKPYWKHKHRHGNNQHMSIITVLKPRKSGYLHLMTAWPTAGLTCWIHWCWSSQSTVLIRYLYLITAWPTTGLTHWIQWRHSSCANSFMKSRCPENEAKATNASAPRITWNWKENLKWCDMKPVQLKNLWSWNDPAGAARPERASTT